jgi:hypothetical protein
VANVYSSAPLKKFTNETESCEVKGNNVAEAENEIGERFPALKDKLLKGFSMLRAY